MAAVIVFLLCDKSIAAVALTFVAVGDPVAGMVGERWGKARMRGKSLVGSGACLLSCLVAGAILSAITDVALPLVVVGALCATLMEFLSLRINDNLTVPLVSGGAMMLVKLAVTV
jgi:dolichol kinase